jgi:hypothetical protein
MKVINLKDGTPHYQGNPGYIPPHALVTAGREHGSVSAIARPMTQQPGREHGNENEDEPEPGTGTESEPNSLPDEAPAVEPEDLDGNKAGLGTRPA